MADLDDVLEALRDHINETGRPIATAPEVAERLDQTRRATLQDLQVLARTGEVERHEVGGRSIVWWPATGASAEQAADAQRDHDGDREPDDDEPTCELTAEAVDDEVARAVELGSQSWEDRPQKLEARRAAARAVLEAIRDAPKAKDELLELRESYPVEEQSARTWWRNNLKSERADHDGPLDYVAEFDRSENKFRWTGFDENE